jgi:hypothetical protein
MRFMAHKYFHITCPTALRVMSISSSMEAAYMEIFQDNSPNTNLIRQEFRPHGPLQMTTWEAVQVSRRNSPLK